MKLRPVQIELLRITVVTNKRFSLLQVLQKKLNMSYQLSQKVAGSLNFQLDSEVFVFKHLRHTILFSLIHKFFFLFISFPISKV